MKQIKWDTLAVIPPASGDTIQYGLAGPVAGACQDYLLVGGGSNFEDAMPWNGGTKRYHDRIYRLSRKDGQLSWTQPGWKLPLAMAYSACLSTEQGIYSLGGETADGPVANAFKLRVEGDSLQLDNLPNLPVAVTSGGAALIGSTIYVVGGIDAEGASKHFFALDTANQDAGWQILPSLPVPLSHAVVAAQADGDETCIYVLGGRNKSGITSTFLSDIWKYSPSQQQWSKAGELKLDGQAPFGLSAGTGLPYGDQYILVFGGDKGNIFNETERLIDAAANAETEEARAKYQAQKIKNLTSHPGFCKEVYLFNCLTGELTLAGEIGGDTQVTTTAFWWNGQIIIPGGEVRPGVRSKLVTRGTLE